MRYNVTGGPRFGAVWLEGQCIAVFRNGQASVTDEAQAAYLSGLGYTVEAAEDLGSMTVAQLRSYAADHGIDLGGATKKAAILAAIREAEGTV